VRLLNDDFTYTLDESGIGEIEFDVVEAI